MTTPEPPMGSTVRDSTRRLWKSWEDGLGKHWWGLAHNGDADPVTWRVLERKYGPVTVETTK